MVRRTFAAAGVVVAASLLLMASAGAASTLPNKIGPNQAFVGLVNGKTGVGPHAQVRVVCPGPAGQPGQTGHPVANQPLEVARPSAVAANFGDTGPRGTHISAFLGIPPSGGTPPTTGALPTFWHYGVQKPIPTSINLPCSGSGYITFMPFPRDPGKSKAFVVPVDFVNIAV
jgi:hypothetical protein